MNRLEENEARQVFQNLELKNYIAGQWMPCQVAPTPLSEPSGGSFLTYQPQSSADALERALTASFECHESGEWRELGIQRASYLRAIAKEIETNTKKISLVEAYNTGVLIKTTDALMALLPQIFCEAARQLELNPDIVLHGRIGSGNTLNRDPIQLLHKPWGPALCLAPWNAPATIGAHKLASALAAGAPAILKPSEWTPFTAQLIFEAIDRVGLPSGAAQLLHGTKKEGGILVKDPRIRAVSFTGGEEGGQKIAQACLPTLKRFQLELGGHNPLIVLPDASFDEVMEGVIRGLITLNGQWCRAIGRIYIPRSWREKFIKGFLDRVSDLKLGPSLDRNSDMGPIIHHLHKQHLLTQVSELMARGASLIGQVDHDSSCFLRPFLLENVPREANQKEVFGPIATLDFFNDKDDARSLAKTVGNSPYGLSAYIYGQDLSKTSLLASLLDVGSTKINGVTLTSLLPNAPRCAWGLSGYGDEGSFETFRFFQGSCVIGSV